MPSGDSVGRERAPRPVFGGFGEVGDERGREPPAPFRAASDGLAGAGFDKGFGGLLAPPRFDRRVTGVAKLASSLSQALEDRRGMFWQRASAPSAPRRGSWKD
ncbi:hypothetical protein [Burkholderia gladioli]|uniref:hypothetical protein n=1 Tax=Burkholderia gladioli TaxID=28095 RepID=UPI001E595270|nr:hypothetical protein [Burkholderia gladioli]MDD1784795.1 hypothetical protein [Burkholderia gladioli]MDJ1165958.1 hypothetical protein [Burkholderia gladioli pv. gladioli]MDN7812758.1 hypothetical protein [Burkholderia gladioli]